MTDDKPAASPAQRRHYKRLKDINAERYALDADQQEAVDRLVGINAEFEEILERKEEVSQQRAEQIAVCRAKGISWNRLSNETGLARITLQYALERGD